MLILAYVILLPTCSLAMCLFGFLMGRFARKLPVVDNNLPWTMHRDQDPRERSPEYFHHSRTGM
jgi:hypothetical protein